MGAYVNRGRVIRPRDQKPAAPTESAPVEQLDLNTATSAQLAKAIDGVGPKTAKDIVANREAEGPFESLADCAERVGGVSLEQLEAAEVTV